MIALIMAFAKIRRLESHCRIEQPLLYQIHRILMVKTA